MKMHETWAMALNIYIIFFTFDDIHTICSDDVYTYNEYVIIT